MTVRTRARLRTAAMASTMAMLSALIITSPAHAEDARTGFSLDFGPGAAAVGYEQVACDTAFDAERGYGFDSGTATSRDRGGDDDLRGDFCFANSMDFSVSLPEGAYTVRVIYGDLTSSQGAVTVFAEEQPVISRAGAAAGQFVDRTFSTQVSDGALSLHLTGSPARINALIITPYSWAPGLALTDDGSGSVQLQNSQVSLRVSKNTAAITELRRNGAEPVRNLLAGGQGDYLANYVVDGVRKQDTLRSASYRVEKQTAERIEVSFSEDDSATLPFELEVHIVLEADSPGFYMYTVYRYPENMPSGLQLEQLRYGFAPDPGVFRWYSIDGERTGVAPMQEELDGGTAVQDATYRLADGTVYSKYQQISAPEGTDGVFGVYGEHVGLSLIQANKDWLGGGPTRQELTTHTGGGPRLLWHQTSAHYTSELITPDHGWEKIYGPYFLYVHEGDSPASMYADAVERLNDEKSRWPYAWLQNPLYDAPSRGSASGHLVTADGNPLSEAWVLLADPDADDWQLDFEDYTYAARTDGDGNFTIPAVRPGTYTLHAFADREFGEYAKADVTVGAASHADLGTLTWRPETNGREVWRIGVPDRSSAEFHVPTGTPSRVPGLEPFREWGTWLGYSADFPEDVDFQVGQDDPATEWNYFQPAIRTPGIAETLTSPYDPTPAEWKIRFDASGSLNGEATLTFAIASSVFGSLAVSVNGRQVASWDTLPGPANDSALYRQSDHGVQRELTVRFDAALLQATDNVISLTPIVPEASDSTAPWTRAFASIMYDALRLEIAAPSWSATTAYEKGDDVMYSGKTYTARWWTRGETPGSVTTGSWMEQGSPVPAAGDGVLTWTPSWIYTGGETVAFHGHLWTAKWWTRNQVPGDPYGPWRDLGSY